MASGAERNGEEQLDAIKKSTGLWAGVTGRLIASAASLRMIVAWERGAKPRQTKMLTPDKIRLPPGVIALAAIERGRTPPAGGGSRLAIIAVRWLASHGVLAACDKSTKMARGTKSPPKEGREKIRILISNSLAVGALRTYNQSANSITANSMSKPYCRSDNGAGRLATSVPLFLPIDPDPGFQTSPLKEGREKIRFLISSSLAVGALRTHDTLFHRGVGSGAGIRHPGGIRCGTCRPGTPTANSTTAN